MVAAGIVRIWQCLSILKNRVQARTAANFKLRIALLLAFSVANVVLGGLVYELLTPEEEWGSSLFTVYAVLFSIPGADITNAPTPLATFLLNLIFIFGLLVFATILAMISEEVNSLLLAARSGRSPLAMNGHILLLNWNSQVSFILDQLERAQSHGRHPFAGRPVVVLADKDKEDMDKLVVGFMRNHQLEVHTRTGKPYILDHLRRVSAADAAAVLVLHPDGDSAGTEGSAFESGAAAALKMQTVLALSSLLQGRKSAVVVQVPESPGTVSGCSATTSCPLDVLDQVLAHGGHSTHLLELPVRRIVNSLAVQTALQPQVATVYQQILQQGEGPNITFIHLPPALFDQKSRAKIRTNIAAAAAGSSGSFIDKLQLPSFSGSSSSSFVGSLSAGGLFRRPGAAAAANQAGSSSSTIETPVAAVAAAHMAAAVPEAASAVAAVAAAAVDGTVAYEDVRARYSSDMLVVGFYRHEGHQLVLNPSEQDRLGPGDVLVALTRHKGPRRVWSPLWSTAVSCYQQLLTLLPTHGSSSSSGVEAVPSFVDPQQQQQHIMPAVAASLGGMIQQQQQQPLPLDQLLTSASVMSAIAEVDQVDYDSKLTHVTDVNNNVTYDSNEEAQKLLPKGACGTSDRQPVGSSSSSSSSGSSSSSKAEALLHKLHSIKQQLSGNYQGPKVTTAPPAAAAAGADDPPIHSSSSSSSSHRHSRFAHVWKATRRFGASKVLQQRHKAAAQNRLASISAKRAAAAAAAASPAPSSAAAAAEGSGCFQQQQQQQQQQKSNRPLHVLVVGYTAAEAAEDLLPHFLDFAPPGTVITIVTDSQNDNLASDTQNDVTAVTDNNDNKNNVVTSLQRLSHRSNSSSGGINAGSDVAASTPTAAAAVGSSTAGVLQDGFELAGVLEEVEQREGDTPVLHSITYRFLPVPNPTSCEGLAAAGLLTADAVLVTAAAAARGSTAQADAHVLGTLVEIQHLLVRAQSDYNKCNSVTTESNNVMTSQSDSVTNNVSNKKVTHLTSFAERAEQMKKASMKRRGIVGKITHPAEAAAPVGSSEDRWQQQQQQQWTATACRKATHVQQHDHAMTVGSAIQQQQQQQQHKRPHIVACVSTTAAKAVADAFFGSCESGAAAAGSTAAAGSCLFSYELLVPGEVESAVLVQVAQQPLYIKVILEMLGTSEGCELYLLDPSSCGFEFGEILRFGEVQEVGRLSHKTVIGVITSGRIVLVPKSDWEWCVRVGDKIAAIAVSW